MIKIVDKRTKEKRELPTLPFFTEFDGSLYMYYKRADGKVAQISLDSGVEQSEFSFSVESAVDNLYPEERIVEVELHIVK